MQVGNKIPGILFFLLLLGIARGATGVNVDEIGKKDEEFALGRNLGGLLVNRCDLFLGTIREIGKPDNEADVKKNAKISLTRKVKLHVDEWLFQKPPDAEDTLQLVHAAVPGRPNKSGDPLWQVWENIEIRVGARLLIARYTKESSRPSGTLPGAIVLVLSDSKMFSRVRDLVALHKRFENDKDAVAPAFLLLRDRIDWQDRLFAGYHISYLMESVNWEPSKERIGQAGMYLSSLLGKKEIPENLQVRIAGWLLHPFADKEITGEPREFMTKSLVLAACGTDPRGSYAAIPWLIRLTHDNLVDVKPYLDAARRKKLLENYRGLLARKRGVIYKRGPHTVQFEAQIGFSESKE